MAAWDTQQGPGYDKQFRFDAGGGGGVASLAALIAQQRLRNQQAPAQAIGQLAGAVGKIMQQRKQDSIASALMNREITDPNERDFYSKLPGSPSENYQQYLWDQEAKQKDAETDLNTRYKNAQINNLNAPAPPKSTVTIPGYGEVTPFQKYGIDHPKVGAGDSVEQVDSDLKAQTGYGLHDWQNPSFVPDDSAISGGGTYQIPARDKDGTPNGETVSLPQNQWLPMFKRIKAVTGAGGVAHPALPANSSPPSDQGLMPDQTSEVIRTTSDGRKAVFDANTKQFLRWAE